MRAEDNLLPSSKSLDQERFKDTSPVPGYATDLYNEDNRYKEMDTTPRRTRMKMAATAEALAAMERSQLQHDAYKQRHEEQLAIMDKPYDGDKK